ncbi:VOC family protein [Ammoniphilus resinae]|uniref:Catechol 2,3-dioxygenase-like lactoylglutathione lyase family enzyme n=1 Tax=Ammoniphilus resinae TaxID=861532 RepID=A0ABS4GWZ5_9BACL|nr:VOC family protein [Ammoniphilus resinae]MBP1934552.1 catechol 2,3-dioxygenase-like lactoylglutathione lyase family enzyme [Ammoniphilus resinae]
MKISIHHRNFSTSNIDKMATFYKNILGMKESTQLPDARIKDQYQGNVRFLLAEEGQAEVHIAQNEPYMSFITGHHVNPLLQGHIAFRVDDIEEVKARLRENNIPFSDYGEWSIKGWYQIFFHDPDGNVIEVSQIDE